MRRETHRWKNRGRRGSSAVRNTRRRGWRTWCAVVLLVSGVALIWKPYSNWKSAFYSKRAAHSLQAGEAERAALEARVALAADDGNKRAAVQLAEAYEQLNDPRLLSVLENLAGEKKTLRYARAALEFGEVELAGESLDAFNPDETDEVIEHSKLGVVWAEMANDSEALFEHLEKLARARMKGHLSRDPALLKLAGLVALSGNMTMPPDLKSRLNELGSGADDRSVDAAVLLWAIASRRPSEQSQSEMWFERLLQVASDGNASEIGDQAIMRALDFAVAFEDDSWKRLLAALQDRAVTQKNSKLVGLILQWMHRHRQYSESAAFATRSFQSLQPDPDDTPETARIVILTRLPDCPMPVRESETGKEWESGVKAPHGAITSICDHS